MNKFSKWWWLNGGSIHRLWKDRKYTDIKELAENLPRAAWEAGVKAERDRVIGLMLPWTSSEPETSDDGWDKVFLKIRDGKE